MYSYLDNEVKKRNFIYEIKKVSEGLGLKVSKVSENISFGTEEFREKVLEIIRNNYSSSSLINKMVVDILNKYKIY